MKKIVSAIGVLALASTLSVPVFAQANGAPGGRMERGEKNERHPEIRKAIRSLEQAKDYMQHAAHDFGGHREEALRACDEAIKQLNEALKYDKR